MTTQQAVVTGLVLGIMLGAAAIALWQQYATTFGTRRRDGGDEDEVAWLRSGVRAHTTALLRRVVGLAQLEQRAATPREIQKQVRLISDALGMVEVAAYEGRAKEQWAAEVAGMTERATLEPQPAPPPAPNGTVRSIR